AAGAAAGMAATFGSPVSAVLLAVELLLFEFRPRSFIPVALAATTAAGIRFIMGDAYPIFDMPALHNPTGWAMLAYFLIGGLTGVVSVGVTRAVYWIEDMFEHLPVHWMWWPAIGAIPLGIIGYFRPDVLGVGYSNITLTLSGERTLGFLAMLGLMKFIAWAIALGSGTSGGTLAPLFTIGGALGGVCGGAMSVWWPHAGIDARVGALVGMAAMFSGASRALLTSVVFAFETTLQPLGMLPLLGGCTAAFFASCVLMPNTIMTEKIARRGVRVPAEYEADYLHGIAVSEVVSPDIVTLPADWTVQRVREWIDSAIDGAAHQGYPVVDERGHLVGVLTRRNLLDPATPRDRKLAELIHRPPVVVYPDVSLREAADHMVNHDIGRLPVIDRATAKVIGMITRSDVLGAHGRRLRDAQQAPQSIHVPRVQQTA
ncbi:MAG TPA: chloride channel protein, partial [Tepidisphaeraceae bacterium]|nr:chloride channel protein [Tepidisphaeraceae bacterium]